ncbi:MAG: hypothetical protein JJD97_11010 [Gemmatimonadaceae bacterium]|nr:hypothetical protein [Gemmatimonadaceae bacterium]
MGQLGVNGLAEEARCDKVLIYRYFGGLHGVLEALGAERMLWPRVDVGGAGDGDGSLADAVQAAVLEEWAALSGGSLMLSATSAEVERENPLGAATAAQRAERHAAMITALREKHRVPPFVDLPALVAILSAALTTFALRAAHAPGKRPEGASGIAFDPGTPEGWRRIEKTVGAITRALLVADGQ